MGRQVGRQAGLLLGAELAAVAAHQAHQAAVLAAGRVQLPPASQEVVVDQADDVKPIGHDAGVEEVLGAKTR